MKNGFKIFDADTHVWNPIDILETYMSSADKEALRIWDAYRVSGLTGGGVNKNSISYNFGQRSYNRRLGNAEPGIDQAARRVKAVQPSRDVDYDTVARIADMDREGVDVNLMFCSTWIGCFTLFPDPAIESAIYAAYNRWMADYCGTYPKRLKGAMLGSGRDVPGTVREIERCGKQDWPLAALIFTPAEMPLDHPDLEPIWAALQEYDLSVTLHTFFQMPPYAPGGLDNWDNVWLQRSAAHPWSGMRNMAAIIGAGILDRYPRLRLGVIEAGHSWLPFWMARLDEQARGYFRGLPALEKKPSEYVLSGRFFQSIEMSEGNDITNAAISVVGEDIFMYASDYPHGEAWFPDSVDTVMAWDMPERTKRKLFWDNAVRFYARFKDE